MSDRKLDDFFKIPFKAKGRDWSGCDCWGLVRLIAIEYYGIPDLPLFNEDYTNCTNRRILDAKFNVGINSFKSVSNPEPGDFVRFRIGTLASHVGIMIDDRHFIHIEDDKVGVKKDSITGMKFEKRVLDFWRYDGKTT